jgi:hypothetical protein
VGNAHAHAAVTLAGWLDVGMAISHTAYFDELTFPCASENVKEFLVSWASMIIGEVFCTTPRVLWPSLLLSPEALT